MLVLRLVRLCLCLCLGHCIVMHPLVRLDQADCHVGLESRVYILDMEEIQ